MKKYKINDDLYGSNFMFVTGCDYNEFIKFVNKVLGTKIEGDLVAGLYLKAVHTETKKIKLFVFVEKNDVLVLVHELMHLVHDTFKYVGIGYNEDNNEAEAYYLEYLLKQVLDKLNPKKKSN